MMIQSKRYEANITVWCHEAWRGLPTSLEVEAYCVGGVDGVFAIFDHPSNPQWFCTARGDDGHWVLDDVMHKTWLTGIAEAVSEYIQND